MLFKEYGYGKVGLVFEITPDFLFSLRLVVVLIKTEVQSIREHGINMPTDELDLLAEHFETESEIWFVFTMKESGDKIVANHYADEAENVYRAREKDPVNLHFIDGGKHMFSKKHDRIAIEYLQRFVR